VVKYPTGDPAAKGVLARLDPTLKPARETRLRVVKEDLSIAFHRDTMLRDKVAPPLASVTAAYTIENPTDKEVTVDFGFPILRGIYISPRGMISVPEVRVTVGKVPSRPAIISNSIIYGIIRQNARETIEKGIGADPELLRLVANVRGVNALGRPDTSEQQAQPALQQQQAAPRQQAVLVRPVVDRSAQREELRSYLADKLKWNARDAALMVEYVAIDFGQMKSHPRDRMYFHYPAFDAAKMKEVLKSNLGPLSAIGEQKATQFFAQLASKFDKEAAGTYEAIFAAWGGDVKERSVDLNTGKVRPRELSITKEEVAKKARIWPGITDPTIYARVDYLDENAKLTAAEKATCKTVLKNLPVVFTFAPMNLLHYQVKFPAGETRVVTINYKQYAYADMRSPASYQLAYVVHPASLWDEFGPIKLNISVPKGIPCRASAPVKKSGESKPVANAPNVPAMVAYGGTLTEPEQKTGELFIAIDRAAWDAQYKKAATAKTPAAKTAGVPVQPKQ